MPGPENLGSRKMHPVDSPMERAGTAPDYNPGEIATQAEEAGEAITSTPEEPTLPEELINSANALRSKVRKIPKTDEVKAIRRNLRRIATGKITDEKEAKKIIEDAKNILERSKQGQQLIDDAKKVGDAFVAVGTDVSGAVQNIGTQLSDSVVTGIGELTGIPITEEQQAKQKKRKKKNDLRATNSL